MSDQRLLVIAAVELEADAVCAAFTDVTTVEASPWPVRSCRGDGVVVDVLSAGMGPAAVAAVAAAYLGRGYAAGLSIGIAGAFVGGGVAVPEIVVADRIIHADLGAQTDDGFIPFDTLGFGGTSDAGTPPAEAVAELARRGKEAGLPVHVGTILTMSTFTGTDGRAAELFERHGAIAEAMEGAGVVTACGLFGVPALEIRTMSNLVGGRDPGAWDLLGSFAAITSATSAMLNRPLPLP
jgi:futalosine hydrolase